MRRPEIIPKSLISLPVIILISSNLGFYLDGSLTYSHLTSEVLYFCYSNRVFTPFTSWGLLLDVKGKEILCVPDAQAQESVYENSTKRIG